MWQTVVVLLVIAAVLVYVVRHYVKVLRGGANICSHCAGCCPSTNGPCDPEADGIIPQKPPARPMGEV